MNARAARAGITGVVIVPEGKIATGKLAQALMHGAKVIALRGNFDQALALVREMASRHPVALVNSINARDYLEVQGMALVVALVYVFVNFIVNFLYTVLDPRVARV